MPLPLKARRALNHVKLYEAYRMFKRAGFPMLPMSRRPIKPPCVLKVNVESTEHKTDKGLVRIAYTKEERDAAASALSKHGEVLYQPLASGVEIFVGGLRDPLFGPMVLTGLGGIYVEVFKKIAARLAPFKDAEEMLKESLVWDVLHSRKKIDPRPLERLLIKTGEFVLQHEGIRAVDFNPVFISSNGVKIADVRVEGVL